MFFFGWLNSLVHMAQKISLGVCSWHLALHAWCMLISCPFLYRYWSSVYWSSKVHPNLVHFLLLLVFVCGVSSSRCNALVTSPFVHNDILKTYDHQCHIFLMEFVSIVFAASQNCFLRCTMISQIHGIRKILIPSIDLWILLYFRNRCTFGLTINW